VDVGELELTFLGTGNAFAPRGLCWNGFLVNGRHLFEAPPQALQSLNRLRINPNAIETVVLSHQHGDHFLGLPFLFTHWNELGRTEPVRIVVPLGTRDGIIQLCNLAYPRLTETTYDVEWVEVRAGEPVDVGPLRLEPVDAKHDPKLERPLGYHAELDGRRFGYTGDSALCDGVLDLARRAEVLVSECSSRDQHLPTHMNLVDDIPQVRRAMQDSAELVLTHLGPRIDTEGLPHTRVAQDLETYRF
jgi:ribonuclease BN (tRNA processing enzyme)